MATNFRTILLALFAEQVEFVVAWRSSHAVHLGRPKTSTFVIGGTKPTSTVSREPYRLSVRTGVHRRNKEAAMSRERLVGAPVCYGRREWARLRRWPGRCLRARVSVKKMTVAAFQLC